MGTDAPKPSGKPGLASSSITSGHQLEGDPGKPPPDQSTQGQLRVGVPPERSPRPPHRREHGREEHPPRAEDAQETDQRTGDTSRMKRYLGERRKSSEGKGS